MSNPLGSCTPLLYGSLLLYFADVGPVSWRVISLNPASFVVGNVTFLSRTLMDYQPVRVDGLLKAYVMRLSSFSL